MDEPDEPAVHWSLFVDESGNFANRYEPVCVAGVLVREPLPRGLSSEALRETLQAAAPEVAWPLHTAYLRHPTYLAVSGHRPGQRFSRDPTFQENCGAAATILGGTCHDQFERVRRAARGGWPVEVSDLRAMDRGLRRVRPDLFGYFEGSVQLVVVLMRLLAEALSKRALAAGDAGVFLIAAGESRPGRPTASRTWGLGLDSSRYLELLEVLIERTIRAVERLPPERGGRSELMLRILRRAVVTTGQDTARPLNEWHLLEIVNRLLKSRPTPVRVVTAPPEPFRGDLHPMFVLADFVAHGSRWPLTDEGDLDHVEARLRTETGATPRATAGSLLAADGLARNALGNPTAQALGRLDGPGVRAWAREQALEWIRVLAR